jgi:hypothetical protein
LAPCRNGRRALPRFPREAWKSVVDDGGKPVIDVSWKVHANVQIDFDAIVVMQAM